MPFFQLTQNIIIYLFYCCGDKKTSSFGQLTKFFPVSQQVLYLDGDVVSQFRKLDMKGLDQSNGMARPVKKIRVPECYMFCTGFDLLTYVCHYHVWLNHKESTVIYRYYRTMATNMLTASCTFGVANNN